MESKNVNLAEPEWGIPRLGGKRNSSDAVKGYKFATRKLISSGNLVYSILIIVNQIRSDQSLSRVHLFATP